MKPQHLAVIGGKLDGEDPSGALGVSLANDLVEHGHRVTLLAPVAIAHELDGRVDLLTQRYKSRWLWVGLRRHRRWVAQTLLDIQPDHTISLLSTVPAPIMMPALGLLRARIKAAMLGSALHERLGQRLVYLLPSIAMSRRHEQQALTSETLKTAVALSPLVERDLRVSARHQDATITRVHLPIPSPTIKPTDATGVRDKFARAWGLNPDAYWITLPFRTAGLGGLEPMLRAFKPLIEQGVDAALLLAGPTRYTHLAWVAQLGLRDRVRLVGKTARIEELMAASDLIACPTKYDPVGWSVLPALAVDKPIITTTACGLADAVKQRGGTVLDGPPEPIPLLEAIREQHGRWQGGDDGQTAAQGPKSAPDSSLAQAIESLLAG